ncbi:MAG: hypothetical protein ACRCV6_01820 [Formosimonas sp.]
MSSLPIDLVQHVARELLERSQDIKITPTLMREISPHPLPARTFKTYGLNAPLSQWRLGAAPAAPLWRTLNPFARQVESIDWHALTQPAQSDATLVFAPLVLDASAQRLQDLALLPNWFSTDGVLLFACLSAGSLPEIVNAQPEWLEQLTHWPNIMDAGARLQELRFGLPVLDVETVELSYSDFAPLWRDVQAFIPHLPPEPWRAKLSELYAQGLRQISLQVLYGQVWHIQAARRVSDTHTVSLESLTAQLPHRKTFGGQS